MRKSCHRVYYALAVRNSDGTVRVPAEFRESIAVLKQTFAEICDPWENTIMERHKATRGHREKVNLSVFCRRFENSFKYV